MHQQINLYQPIFREERKLFSLKTVLVAMAIVIASLLGMWALGARNVANLERAVTQLREQQAAQEQLAQKANAMLSAQGNPAAVEAEVKRLSALLAERTNALNLLRSGAAGESRGFAPRLAALARQRADGVWLEELVLGGGANGLILRGRSVSAERIPKYLQMLTAEPELSGARFDEVVLDRRKHHESEQPSMVAEKEEDGNFVRFSVSSSAAARQVTKAADDRSGS